jgi:hypothetical protein
MGPCDWCRDWRRLTEVRAPPEGRPAAICEDCHRDELAETGGTAHQEGPAPCVV